MTARHNPYWVPGRILDLAYAADRRPVGVRPEDTARIAELILEHLPRDHTHVIKRRVDDLKAATQPRPRQRRTQ